MNKLEEELVIRELASEEIDCIFRVIFEFCEYGRYHYINIYCQKLDSLLRAFQISRVFNDYEVAFLYRCLNSIFDLSDYTNVGRFL